MNHYGTITALFHGKAENLRKLAPLVWDKPELEELKEQLQVDPALAPEAETTLRIEFFSGSLCWELPCIDMIANRCPNVEIAVAARISDSITDGEGRYSTFYPLDRKFYEDDEEDGEEEDDGEEDYDAANYVDHIEDSMKVEAAVVGFEGNEYKIDLTDQKIRPAKWDFYQQDPDLIEWLEDEDLAEIMEPFQAVLVKCNPKTGAITRVEGDDGKFGPSHDGAFAALLPEVSVRTEEKDGKRFYLDSKGNEYFFLGDLPIEAIQFGRIASGWFDEYPDRPAWLRELEQSL